jgi:acetate kinase
LPAVASRLPIALSLHDAGLRRYGFHGLSYEYIVEKLGPRLGARAIIAHLGNGASLAAVRDGVSVDTTMGLTPDGGIMMGTRSGDLDPGVVLHLLRSGHDVQALTRMLEREAGLLGVSGVTSDMKELLERRARDPRCALAVAMFTYAVRKAIGSFVAGLGGVDSLVFTGGIGEHSAVVRAEACANLRPFGIQLDDERNDAGVDAISPDGAPCTVHVVATDEEHVVARHTREVLAPS